MSSTAKAYNKGVKNIDKAMKAIIKKAEKENRCQFSGAFIANDMQCVCDGYRAIRLHNAIDLPRIQNDFDITQIFSDLYVTAVQPLELPDLPNLKAYIKRGKAKNKANGLKANTIILYDFGENAPAVNAEYLADILTAFPAAIATWTNPIKPILFTDTAGDALLLPVRKSQTYTKGGQ